MEKVSHWTWNLEHIDLAKQKHQIAQINASLLAMVLESYATVPDFYFDSGDLDLGPFYWLSHLRCL